MLKSKAAEAHQEHLAQSIRDYQDGKPVTLTRIQLEEMDDTAGLRTLRTEGLQLIGAELFSQVDHLGAVA